MCMFPRYNDHPKYLANISHSRVTDSSIIAVQIFDQKKFKKKDQGFLGVINVRVGDVLDLLGGGEGLSILIIRVFPSLHIH
jgi:E3 ubiquitin-protein ligase NEDD4